MTVPTWNCWRCGKTHQSFQSLCDTCQQTDRMEKVARDNREHQEDMARESAYRAEQAAERYAEQSRQLAQEQAWQLEQDRQARVDEMYESHRLESDRMREAAELQAEASIGYDGAYKYGYEFFEKTFPKRPQNDHSWAFNNLSFSSTQSETGEADLNPTIWKFSINLLKNAAIEGFKDRVSKEPQPSSFDYMMDQAYQKGFNGEDKFTIESENKFLGMTLTTEEFDAEFNFVLDEATGEYTLYRCGPFKNDMMNDAYFEGLSHFVTRLNSDEQCEYRLKDHIPQLQAERAEAEREVERTRLIHERQERELAISRERHEKNTEKLHAEWENREKWSYIVENGSAVMVPVGWFFIWQMFDGGEWFWVTVLWAAICLFFIFVGNNMRSSENRSAHYSKINSMK